MLKKSNGFLKVKVEVKAEHQFLSFDISLFVSLAAG